MVYTNELYHHGIKGQRWGVRRYRNEDGSLTEAGKKREAKRAANFERQKAKTVDRINLMYDRANKWTNRKVDKLDAKGKTAKADVWRYAAAQNEKARAEKIAKVKSASQEDYKKMRAEDRLDSWLGGQKFMKANSAHMTTPLSRATEYDIQRGMRICSNLTFNSTLSRMTPAEGYEYLRAQQIYDMGRSSGRASD
jgi:hypothetical protein